MELAACVGVKAYRNRQRGEQVGGMYHFRRAAVMIIGGTVTVIGVALIVLPGPSILVIPAGLAILATEFEWARRLLSRFRWQLRNLRRAAGRLRRRWFGRGSAAEAT